MACCVTFSVKMGKQLRKNEVVFLTGNVEELGCWNQTKAMVLSYSEGKWIGSCKISSASSVRYRYFVGIRDEFKVLQVRTWESHILEDCRLLIIPNEEVFSPTEDQFGVVNGKRKLDSGWLTQNTEVRISISSLSTFPFVTLAKQNLSTSASNLSVKPVVIPSPSSLKLKVIQPCSCKEVTDISDRGIKVPDNEETHILCVVETSKWDCSQIAFEIYSGDEMGTHLVGRTIVCAGLLPTSKGILRNPLIDQNGVAIGSVRLPYLVIKPTDDLTLTMENCFTKHWKKRSVYVGHRGCGNSFTSQKLSNVRENSIASFRKAAENGAFCVEFDVHLTKDKVPIVYHDLTTCIAVAENSSAKKRLLEIPVGKLTLDDLRTLATDHRSKMSSPRLLDFKSDADQSYQEAFPTLQEVFEEVPCSTGFNIEIKWPTLDMNNEYEDRLSPSEFFDANEFIDVILNVVFSSAKSRRIIFSSFDVDICTMVRRKQNKYPVLFLTNGDTLHYTPMLDLRERTNDMAIGTILSEGFLGLNSLENDVYKTPDIVKKVHDLDLVFACYGDDVGDNLTRMRDLSVDIAIFDRIYEVESSGKN